MKVDHQSNECKAFKSLYWVYKFINLIPITFVARTDNTSIPKICVGTVIPTKLMGTLYFDKSYPTTSQTPCHQHHSFQPNFRGIKSIHNNNNNKNNNNTITITKASTTSSINDLILTINNKGRFLGSSNDGLF